LWIPLLLVSAGLAAFGDKTSSTGVAEARRVDRSQGPVAAARAPSAVALRGTTENPPTEILALRDRTELIPVRSKSQLKRDLFAPATWASRPPTPAVKTLPPADPTPPLPSLSFIGKKHEAGSWEVYLTQGAQTLIAREGDTLDGDLRVERIAPPEMILTQPSTGRSMKVDIGDAP
jgi:hypothetical protein